MNTYATNPHRVPLTEQQIQDYQALLIGADELFTAGCYQEASLARQVAMNILRTGAPALE